MIFFVHFLFLGIALYAMLLASMVSVKNLVKLGNEKIAGEERSFLSFSKTLSVQTNVFGPVEFMYRGHHGGERIQSDSFLSDSNTTSDEALQFVFLLLLEDSFRQLRGLVRGQLRTHPCLRYNRKIWLQQRRKCTFPDLVPIQICRERGRIVRTIVYSLKDLA